ncbi:hypothetical protein KGQ20_43875, partial [Catenulispora sp. NF23]|uniref:Integral membrane protein n=1 Tax=Catenulispora pinistramenti TaxID=2705254 RepID=A0ABS5L7Z0_9ACTN|nr:hypothetical protein [Catenulispora pinistramenti]MBS2539704.1 hypothetical protein [Catenulispora pinistramenti]MBS2554451.1 hypothetical protein [Catenulispora pinistramenti]
MTTPSTDSVDATDDAVLEAETETAAVPAADKTASASVADDIAPDEIVPELVEDEDDYLDADLAPEPERTGSGIATGAAAIVAAGLALTSMGGSWLGDVLAQRQTLIGQINTANSAADAIIKQRYTEPWHKTALVGIWFAVAAMLVAAATLFVGEFFAKRPAPTWVRALTWGALALGIVGLGVSAAMYFDVFTGTISVPAGSASTGGQ